MIVILFLAVAINTQGFAPAHIRGNIHVHTTKTRLLVFGSRVRTITNKNSPLLDEALSTYPY